MKKSKSPKSRQQNSTSECFQINLRFFAATVAITSQLKRPHFLHDLFRKSAILFGKGRVWYEWDGEEFLATMRSYIFRIIFRFGIFVRHLNSIGIAN